MDINGVRNPLVIVTIDNPPVEILVDMRSSINLLAEEAFRSLANTSDAHQGHPICM